MNKNPKCFHNLFQHIVQGVPKKTWTLFGAILVSLSANPSVKVFFGTPCSKDYIQFFSSLAEFGDPNQKSCF